MRCILIVTVLLGAFPLRAADAVISIHVTPVPVNGGEVIVKTADDPKVSERVISISTSGDAKIEVKPSSLLAIRARVAHLWSSEKVVLVTGPTEVTLPLFATGVLRGRAASDKLPVSIDVGFEPVVGKIQSAPAGSVVCPLARDGKWQCELPEGVFDLRLHVTGFIPVMRTAVLIAASHDVELAEFALRSGASVAGRIRTRDGGPLTDSCHVTLLPRTAATNSDKAAHDEALRRVVVSPDARGRFQFIDVPPGSYDLVVNQPGYAQVWRRRIPVVARTEAMLSEVITIERPSAAEIIVSPSADPSGRQWVIRLFDAEGSATRLDPLAVGSTQDGHRRFAGLSPGRYFITVSSGEQTWFGEDRNIAADGDIVQLEIPSTRVDGHVSLGGRPIAADVTFIDKQSSVSISFSSNEEGELTGVLPRRQTWDVKVSAPQAHVFRTLKNVRVAASGDKAHFVIDLPDTTVKGTVVNADGTPHGDGFVSGQDQQSHQQLPVARDGTFEFAGFDGDVTLQATATGDRASDQVTVHVSSDAPIASAVLKLRPTATVEGRVISAGGPVPGSRVFAIAATASAGVIFPQASDAAGEFRVRLLDASEDALVTVMSPGYALWHGRIRVGDHAEILLNQLGGTLKVRKVAGSRIPYVEIGGTPILYAMLANWSTLNGSPQSDSTTLTVTDAPAGSYVVCLPDGGLTHADLRNGRRTGARCVAGVLPPMGDLLLDLSANAR